MRNECVVVVVVVVVVVHITNPLRCSSFLLFLREPMKVHVFGEHLFNIFHGKKFSVLFPINFGNLDFLQLTIEGTNMR